MSELYEKHSVAKIKNKDIQYTTNCPGFSFARRNVRNSKFNNKNKTDIFLVLVFCNFEVLELVF